MSQNVLLLTDFSTCAGTAEAMAKSWCLHRGMHLHVLHRINGMPADWDELPLSEQGMYPGIQEKLAEVKSSFDEMRARLKDTGSNLTMNILGGNFIQVVSDYVSAHNISLVFMGTRGTNKRKKTDYLGSKALRVLRNLDVPVLITKEESNTEVPRTVVFASGFGDIAERAYKKVIGHVAVFDPVVHLVNIDTPMDFGVSMVIAMDTMRKLAENSGGLDVIIHFYQHSKVGEGIVEYCSMINADLVAFSESGHSMFLGDKLPKSVRYLVNNAPQPLLFVQVDESDS